MTTISRDALVASARDYASRALKAYVDEDLKVVLVDAAVGLEHLSKAFLYDLDPALLMEIRNGQLDSLLHLTGHGDRAKKLTYPKTISGREAVARVGYLLPKLAVPKDRIDQLVDVRDGVVHAGFLVTHKSKEILTAYLRLCDALYEELQVDEHARWGQYSPLVKLLISESMSGIEQEVKERMAAARVRIDDLLSKLPKSEHNSIMAARQSQEYRFVGSSDETVEVECPVCGDGGASCIGVRDTDVEVDTEPDGEGGYVSTVVGATDYVVATSFVCGSCELKLNSADELDAAGIERFVDVSDEHESNWY